MIPSRRFIGSACSTYPDFSDYSLPPFHPLSPPSFLSVFLKSRLPPLKGWLGSRVVSVLDSGAEGLGSTRSRDAVG